VLFFNKSFAGSAFVKQTLVPSCIIFNTQNYNLAHNKFSAFSLIILTTQEVKLLNLFPYIADRLYIILIYGK